MRDASRVTGWWLFAGTMLLVLGTLNVIWGIAAIGDSTFFTEDAKYVLSGLNTWGWVTLLIGIVQLFAWTKAPLLSRNELLPADGLDEQRAARSDEFKRLGDPTQVPRGARRGRGRCC